LSDITYEDDDDRGASPDLRSRRQWLSKKVLILGVIGVAAGVILFAVWHSSQPKPEKVEEKLPAQLGATVAYQEPKMPIAPKPPAPEAAPAPRAPAAAVSQPLIIPQVDPIQRVLPSASVAQPPAPKPYMLSYADPPAANGRNGAPGRSGAGGGSDAAASGINYTASKLDGIQAGLMGDQTLLLTPGILVCILDTAINSTFSGPVECHVPFDVKPHGVTLLDRGSVIHGFYSGTVQNGQSRIAIAADWVEDRTTGCFIKFDNAPFSNGLGVSGVPGNVDNHLLERFGAAMLLTLGDSSMSLAQAMLSRGGNTYLSFNGGGDIQSVANTILQKQIGIPPTITVNQSTPVAVFVNKVLDFSPCYSLELKGRSNAPR
jgi:type IV secretion system protein VirB10